MKHDYVAYANGCRCDLCRADKAAYVRRKRAAAAELRRAAQAAGQTYVAAGIRHGLSGYQNHSCRCGTCCRAKKANEFERQRGRSPQLAVGPDPERMRRLVALRALGGVR